MSTTPADPAARRRSLAMMSVAVAGILVASSLVPRPAGIAGVDPRLIGLYEGHLIELALAIVAIVALARGDLARWGFTLRGARSSVRSVATFAAAYVPIIVVITAAAALARGVRPSLGDALTARDVLALVAFEAAFVGVAEEVLFRGLVQSYLAPSWVGSVRVGAVELPLVALPSAAIFAFAHVRFVPLQADPLQLALAFGLGLVYATARARTGSLLAPILMHDAADGLATAATFVLGGVL